MVLKNIFAMLLVMVVSGVSFAKVDNNNRDLSSNMAGDLLSEIIEEGFSVSELDRLDRDFAEDSGVIETDSRSFGKLDLSSNAYGSDYQRRPRTRRGHYPPRHRYPRHNRRPRHRGSYYPPRMIYCYAASEYGGFFGYAYNPRTAQNNALRACGYGYQCYSFGCGPQGKSRMNQWLYGWGY